MKSLRARSSDGLELEVSAWRTDGRPVLFVHGFSNDRFVFEDVARALSAEARPIAHDLRGHGDSDWSIPRRYHLHDHAGDLWAVLEALELDRVALVGHSLGGNVATLFAARHPERVEALVLVDTGPSLSADAWRWASADVSELARAYDSIAEYRRLLAFAYPMGSEAALDRMARTSLFRRRDGRYEPKLDPALLDLLGSEDQLQQIEAELWDALAKLRCPVLLARGERSAMLSPDVARRMTRQVLCHGRLVEIPGAGHAVAIDSPAALAREIDAFLARP